MELIMENVRCFAGRHRVPIKPLTILVGENSSGKTSLLAALSVVCNTRGLGVQPNFNIPPYSLGNFDTILTSRNGKQTQTKHFSIGLIRNGGENDHATEFLASYISDQGRAQLLRLTAKRQKDNISIEIDESHKKYKYQYQFKGESRISAFTDPKEGSGADVKYLAAVIILRDLMPAIKTLSIAPVRTRPERTYDQFIEKFNPEGAHIPFILDRILSSKTTSEQKKILVSTLEQFGKESGLFKNIEIKKLGDSPSDPFQVVVEVAGKKANLVDVGYGVSQLLPLVVQSILAADESLILLQQPEVHLHPKAQAALGSFFVDMVADGGKQFVVETHSDYIVDRIRQEVAAGKIKSDSVSILFFEKSGIETKIYQIGIDDLGNVVGAPPSYREFFLQEELNLLTRGRR